MENHFSFNGFGRKVGAILLFLAAFCGSFVICLTANGETLFDENSDYFIGADGRSYGIPIEGDEGTIVMPDMVRVKATNGEIGYMSPDEMTNAFFEGAVEQNEIEEVLASLADKKAQALTDAATRRFGFEVVTYSEAFEIGNLLVQEGGISKAKESMRNISTQRLASALEDGAVSFDEVEEAAIMTMDDETNLD